MLDDILFRRHLEKDEVVTDVVHKHWILGMRFLIVPTISFLGGWGVLYFAPLRLIFFLATLWAIGSLVWWLRNFFDYYLDAWIVTNQGIIDLEWHGWFHRQSSRILYSDIQGVSYEIVGVLGTFLRFGTVGIEKISTGGVIAMSYVPHPRRVEALILGNMEEYLHAKNLKDARHVRDLLSEFVATEVQLQKLKGEGNVRRAS